MKPVYIPTLLDLELLHHFTTVTCFTVSNIPSKQQIWQVAVPREAMSHQFLLHALLAVAAVNIMYLDPTKRHRYEIAASSHRNLALSMSIPALNEVTPDNCHALFSLSCIVSLLAFAFPYRRQLVSSSKPLDDILGVFVLIRGVQTVLQSAQEWISRGPLGALIGNWNSTVCGLPEDMNSALEKLFDKNETDTPDPSSRELYKLTIQSLRKAFEINTAVQGDPGLVFTWLLMVQGSYVAQLEKKDPMALVILAHYAVLIHSTNGQWWIEGRGAQLFEAIYRILPLEWLPAVELPRKVVTRGCRDGTTDLVRAESALSVSPSRDNGGFTKPECKFETLRDEWYEGFMRAGSTS